MQPMRLKDVRELVASPAMRDWARLHQELREELRNARERLELAQVEGLVDQAELLQRLADDDLFEAGEYELQAARELAAFTAIENASYEALSQFELQRDRVRELYIRMQARDNDLEERRQELSEMIAAGAAGQRAQLAFSEGEHRRLALEVERLHAEVAELTEQYQQAEAVKDQLWVVVEEAWSTSFEHNMARTELQYQARRLRARAEERYGEAQHVRSAEPPPAADPEALRALSTRAGQVAERLAQHLQAGRELSGGCLVQDFIYWPRKDDVKFAYCVPLVRDDSFLNIQVQALEVYQVERARGLEWLEPVVEQSQADDDDPRLEAFFATATAGDSARRT